MKLPQRGKIKEDEIMTIYIVWYKRGNETFGIWGVYGSEERAVREADMIENEFKYQVRITDEEVLE